MKIKCKDILIFHEHFMGIFYIIFTGYIQLNGFETGSYIITLVSSNYLKWILMA